MVVLSIITTSLQALWKTEGITLLHKNLQLIFSESSSFTGYVEWIETIHAQQNKKQIKVNAFIF